MGKEEVTIGPYEGSFPAVLLIGPPGSGKGTVGARVAEAGGQVHLSTGEIVRQLSPHSSAGKLFHHYSSRGELGPDELMIGIFHHYLQGLVATNRLDPIDQLLLLDGIPRTLSQAQLLDGVVDVRLILLFEMDKEKLILRLKARGKKGGRKDDVDEAILRRRMEVYQTQTLELLSHYSDEQIVRIHADQKPLDVLREVLQWVAPLCAELPQRI